MTPINIPHNTKCYIISDVHGKYSELQQLIHDYSINEEDIVIFQGDLINKGKENIETLDYALSRPNTYILLGNHEEVFVDYFLHNKSAAKLFLESAGGSWVFPQEPSIMKEYASKLNEKAILAIELNIDSFSLGVCHAAVPFNDWQEIRNDPFRYKKRILWDESHFNAHLQGKYGMIKNIDGVMVGHIPVESYKTIGNVIYMDTGSLENENKIGILEIRDAIKILNLKESVIEETITPSLFTRLKKLFC